ncbi:hypothetical protein [Roseibium sp.]|uniref:hypothetical protein n=1 Tax=Roseibium sp. TaxID=1936156 RepID=UPI003B50DDB9
MFDLGGWAMSVGSGVVSVASVWGLSAVARPDGSTKGHVCYLTYSRPCKWIAAALVPLSVLVVLAMAHAPARHIALAFVVTAAFLALTLFVVYQVFFVRFGYDRNAIYFDSPFLRNKKTSWNELEYVGHSNALQINFLEVSGIGRIWCSSFQNGHRDLARFLETKAELLLTKEH